MSESIAVPEPLQLPWISNHEALMNSSAQEFLNGHVTSFLIEGAAEYAHESWRATKLTALEDPMNPYHGWGPSRLKVGQLDTETRQRLGVDPISDPAADVYHPLDLPYSELGTDTKSKNIVPMLALCNTLGDIVLDAGSTLIDLQAKLKDFVNNKDATLVDLISKIHHIAFSAGELRTGSRPYGTTARDDFPLYEKLSGPVQRLDYETLVPIAQFMLQKLRADKHGNNFEIREAIFNSARTINSRRPLMRAIIDVCRRPETHPYDGWDYLTDEIPGRLGLDFVDDALITSRDYCLDAVFSREELIATRDQLTAVGVVYKSPDGTWRYNQTYGAELIKELEVA